jgi:hypothetical protein
MGFPSFHVTISASVVAAYAAVVATATATVQFSNYLRDRARIKLRVQHNMQIIGGGPGVDATGLTMVYVMNSGRRPVTITTVGARRIYPHTHLVIPRCNPVLPHELTEGKSVIAMLPPCDLDFSTISCWEASDALGRNYRLHVAPWYARLSSHLKQRREWRRNHAAKKKVAAEAK